MNTIRYKHMRSLFANNDSDHLEHHGILGMKWGVRRFQNKDGSLTDAGRKHYLDSSGEFRYPNSDRSKTDIKVNSEYRNRLNKEAKNEFDEILKIKDKKEKVKAEKEFLDAAMSEEATDKDAAKASVLMKEYETKMGNFYMGTSVTSEHERAIKEYRKLMDESNEAYKSHDKKKIEEARKNRADFDNKFTGEVLQAIGFENDPINYENGYYIWAWD